MIHSDRFVLSSQIRRTISTSGYILFTASIVFYLAVICILLNVATFELIDEQRGLSKTRHILYVMCCRYDNEQYLWYGGNKIFRLIHYMAFTLVVRAISMRGLKVCHSTLKDANSYSLISL